jgi:hypothetical protein
LAKVSGLGWTTATLNSVAIVNDITDLQFATPRAVQDVTGLDKSAYERLLLLADFTCTPKGVFNVSASHSVLKTTASAAAPVTFALAVASQTLSNSVIVTDYQLSRSTTGELTWQAPMSLASGTVPAWS